MNNDGKIKHWDDMYKMPLEQIPWEIKDPPQELIDVIENGHTQKGKALDIGCGTGNYSFYLAQRGFEVVGIDFSKQAIEIARKNSKSHNLPVRFLVGDITKLSTVIPGERFDFILDYSILHHLDHSVTKNYAKQFKKLLKPNGKLLLVCYSEKDEFASKNKSATGKYGIEMYYRTADEIRYAYKDLREVYYKETRLGKRLHHIAHCFLYENVI